MRRIASGFYLLLCDHWLRQHSILIVLTVMLTVLEAAPLYRLPEYNETPDNVTYYRGERAILQCSVKFLGTKQVIWRKANSDHALTVGNMLFSGDADISIDHIPHREEWNLIITNVQTRHAGLYECQISTKEDLRKYVQLNVRDEPVPRSEAIKIEGTNYVEKGQRISLTCDATGEIGPPDDIDWFKDGRKIKESQNEGISISKFRIASTRTLHSVLDIAQSDMDDSGNYICRSSELSITDQDVMVLNGSAKRSRKKTLTNGDINAETNPNKRGGELKDNNKQAPQSTSGSSSVYIISYNNSCLLTQILTLVCLLHMLSRDFHMC